MACACPGDGRERSQATGQALPKPQHAAAPAPATQALCPLQEGTPQPMPQDGTSSRGTREKRPPPQQLQQAAASPGGSCVPGAALLRHCQHSLGHPERLSLCTG